MTPGVLAHAGHWFTALAFFGPVLVLPLALLVIARRHADEPEPDAARRPTPTTEPPVEHDRPVARSREW